MAPTRSLLWFILKYPAVLVLSSASLKEILSQPVFENSKKELPNLLALDFSTGCHRNTYRIRARAQPLPIDQDSLEQLEHKRFRTSVQGKSPDTVPDLGPYSGLSS
jgi:hypothetical protein